MNRFIEENSNEYCQIELTGYPSLYVKINSSLIKSQYNSLLIAIVLVILIVGSMLKSVSLGIYGTIPVIATIVILFGFMGVTGYPARYCNCSGGKYRPRNRYRLFHSCDYRV